MYIHTTTMSSYNKPTYLSVLMGNTTKEQLSQKKCKMCDYPVYYKIDNKLDTETWNNTIEENSYVLIEYSLCHECLHHYTTYETCVGCHMYNGTGDLCRYCRRGD